MIIFRDHVTHLKKSNKKDLHNKNKEFRNSKMKKDSFSMKNNSLKNKYKH